MNRDKIEQICCKRKERNRQYLNENRTEIDFFLKWRQSFSLWEKIE